MMDSDFEVDFTITTASYSTMTVGVYDIVGNELCMLSTDGAYNGADGNESSCSVEENYIEIVVIDADYYTYFGAFYANYGYSGYGPTDNINVTTDAGTDTYAASYTWYSSSFGDSEYSLDEFYSISENGTMGDMDDDNDGYPDLAETHYCGSSSAKTGYASDSLDNNSTPLDTDGDLSLIHI